MRLEVVVLDLDVVEAVENNLPQQVGDTNNRIFVLVETIGFEDFLADNRLAQAQDGIFFRREVIEESAG